MECMLVQKNKANDVVVLQSQNGKIDVSFPKGEGDKFFTAGKNYTVEFSESNITLLTKVQ